MRLNCGITGIKIEVDETDKLLAASRAVIPVFHSQNWRYTNLFEVLFYPNKFNEYFKTDGKNRRVLGGVWNWISGRNYDSTQANTAPRFCK